MNTLLSHDFERFQRTFAVAEFEVVCSGGVLADLERGEVFRYGNQLEQFALAVEEMRLQSAIGNLKPVKLELCEILRWVRKNHGAEGDVRVGTYAYRLDFVWLLHTFGYRNGAVAIGCRLSDNLADCVADTAVRALRIATYRNNRRLA